MRQIQNLKICVLKQYELLLALHVAYLLEFPNEKEKYDFIEKTELAIEKLGRKEFYMIVAAKVVR